MFRKVHMRMKSAYVRFWEHVVRGTEFDCWLWLSAKGESGHGRFHIGGTKQSAHRISWLFEYGPIPYGLHVLHRCDTPACVNPNHLFLGTHLDNMKDRDDKGRTRTLLGENSPNAILTNHQVRLIKRLSKETTIQQATIARLFSVSPPHISGILRGKAWRSVQ